ncbi:hypothetical protein UCMB321_4049 [Pseudomonas batumici]|uniref:Uncharacterized protein n=1 Tax=Pseudomonas batumici TaxID=226910 RepID=A0A0C2ETZ1_9PSED|nr:hypothetical protein UCMB321_4049 [Pseudomonas batumici]
MLDNIHPPYPMNGRSVQNTTLVFRLNSGAKNLCKSNEAKGYRLPGAFTYRAR